jgi:UPF0755 protein
VSKPGRTLLIWLSVSAVLLIAAATGVYWQFSNWSNTPISDRALFRLELNPGQSLAALAHDLQDAQYLLERRRFVLLGRLTGAERRLQAGEYDLAPTTTPRLLLEQLSTGAVVTYDFRIEEGSTVSSLLLALAADETLQHELLATDVEGLHAELGLQSDFAEGMFFPDTYQFRRGDSDRELLLRAHRALLTEAESVWLTRAVGSSLGTPAELVILASIIEKETGLETDRTQISQVFHKRLQERMLLQTDPTVIYALGASFDGNLTRAHLKMNSVFNTYRVRGLPPTPIALPSRASLHAAAHPAEGDYLYFVAKGNGASKFSRTLAEHNSAVRKYQLNGGGSK